MIYLLPLQVSSIRHTVTDEFLYRPILCVAVLLIVSLLGKHKEIVRKRSAPRQWSLGVWVHSNWNLHGIVTLCVRVLFLYILTLTYVGELILCGLGKT